MVYGFNVNLASNILNTGAKTLNTKTALSITTLDADWSLFRYVFILSVAIKPIVLTVVMLSVVAPVQDTEQWLYTKYNNYTGSYKEICHTEPFL